MFPDQLLALLQIWGSLQLRESRTRERGSTGGGDFQGWFETGVQA